MSTAGVCGTGSTSRRTVTTELTSCTGGDHKGDKETHDPVYIAGGRGHARRCSTSCASMQVKSVQQQGEGQMTSITQLITQICRHTVC